MAYVSQYTGVEIDAGLAKANSAVQPSALTSALSSKVDKITSVDNTLARFDGTTGALQGSSISVSDTAAITGVASLQLTGGTSTEGKFSWNAGDGTADLTLAGGQSTLQLGQEQIVRVKNNTGSGLTDGQVVYITGAQGQRPTVALADADLEQASASTIGVVTEPIADGSEGFVTLAGLVRNLDTSAWVEGSQLFASSTAGALTSTKPIPPLHAVRIGWVVRQHASAGSILVHVQNGYELDELHDVLLTSPQANQLLYRNSSNTLWENTSGIVWDEVNDRLGISNTAPAASIDISTDPLWTIGTSPTPTAVASDTGGTVPAGTYYFKVVASFRGGVAAASAESTGVTVTTSTGSITISWAAVPGATTYTLYRTTVLGTYTSPSLVAVTSGVSFVWNTSTVTLGTASNTASQNVYSGKLWVNDLFTTTGIQYSSATINSVSSITANSTDLVHGLSLRKTVPASNTYNHGIQRGLFVSNDFRGSGILSGSVTGIFCNSQYTGTGSSVGNVVGTSSAASYGGSNTLTMGSVVGVSASASITSAGRVSNMYGGIFSANVLSTGVNNPTAGTVYGTRADALHNATGQTVDAMYGSYGLANATSTGGTATRIQGGFFQASVGNGTGGATVTSSAQRGIEGRAFQNNTGVTSELTGGLLTASSYGTVSSETVGGKLVGENQSTAGTNPLVIGSKMYALNYQTVDTMMGGFAEVQHNANTLMYSARGVTSAVINNSGGTINDARGYNVSVLNNNGTITDGYGLFIGNVQATNAWGVYQQSSTIKNHFGSQVLIGSTNDRGIGAKLQVTGAASMTGVLFATRTVTTNTTASIEDYVIRCNCASNDITVALPSASTVTGLVLIIKKVANTGFQTILEPSSMDLIDGSTTASILVYNQSLMLQSNGTSWDII